MTNSSFLAFRFAFSRSDAGAARLRRFKRQFGPKRLSRQKLLGHHSVVIRGRRMLEHIEGLHEFIGQGEKVKVNTTDGSYLGREN